MRLPALLLALLASTALAQGKPTLIDHPVDVKTAINDAQQTAVQDDFRQQLARNIGILVPTRSNWKAAQAALKRQDCDIRNECLRQLATTAGTLYALYTSLERNAAGTELTATGRVVNQDGLQVRPPTSATVKKKTTFEDAAHDALAALLTKLELEKLSPVLTPPPVEVKPAEPEARLSPPPVPPNEQVVRVNVPHGEPGTPGMKVAGFVVGGLAVVAGAVTLGFGLSALGARGSLPSDGRLVDANQVRMQQSVNQSATIALASGLTTAALAITSVTLLALSPTAGTSVSLAPVPGGAAMVMGGTF